MYTEKKVQNTYKNNIQPKLSIVIKYFNHYHVLIIIAIIIEMTRIRLASEGLRSATDSDDSDQKNASDPKQKFV